MLIQCLAIPCNGVAVHPELKNKHEAARRAAVEAQRFAKATRVEATYVSRSRSRLSCPFRLFTMGLMEACLH